MRLPSVSSAMRQGLIRGFTGADVAEDTWLLSAVVKEVGLQGGRLPLAAERGNHPPAAGGPAKTKIGGTVPGDGLFAVHIPKKENEAEGGRASYFGLS